MNLPRRAFAWVVAVALAGLPCAGALGQTPPDTGADVPEPIDGACSARVAAVAPLDATRTLQAVVLESAAAESSTIAGTVAAFTAAGRRYDLRFEHAPIGPDAPLVLAYRFPDPLTVTGAYVAKLDTPQPGACGIIGPWTSDTVADTRAQRALALAAQAPPRVVAVSGDGSVDTLACRSPQQPARVLTSARPELEFWKSPGALPAGAIAIRVLVGPDGHALDVHVDHVDATIAETSIGTALTASALVAAMHSTYAPETFRCRPIYGFAAYVMNVRPHP